MGSLGLPRLAAAVANAGALGMLGWGGAPPEHVVKALEATRRATTGPFGMNFIADGWTDPISGAIDPDASAGVEAAAARCRVIEFFYAPPDASLVDRAHDGGALASWQVGTVEEAVAAEQADCDFIVAQGVEAGGHVRGRIPLRDLLKGVVAAVGIPVVAAGGIGTGRAMAAAIDAGAAAVRVGTRFVAAVESEAHPLYVERLIAATAKETVLTGAFSTNWPNAPHRVLRGSLDAMQACRDEVIGARFPAWAPDEAVPVHRGDSVVAVTTTTGRIEAMPHWAGESVDAVKRVQTSEEIVRELVDEALASRHASSTT
jgi:nitronate monooxygenase